jgi:CRP-like cAMP-binding protein
MTTLPTTTKDIPLTEADCTILRSVGLFSVLPADALAALLAQAQVMEVSPFESVFEQEEDATALFVVTGGTVGTLAALNLQDSCLVELLGPGQVVGEGGLFDTGRAPLAARAITTARLIAFPRMAVLASLDASPPFRRRMVAFLSARLRVLVREITQLKLMTAPQRLGAFLLGLTTPRPGPQRIELACERRILARILGMTPESLSRALRQLQALGVRSQGKRGILIEDRTRLQVFRAS